jgi:hypothetical protein
MEKVAANAGGLLADGETIRTGESTSGGLSQFSFDKMELSPCVVRQLFLRRS